MAVFEMEDLDLIPYIKQDGVVWSENDIDEDSERTLDDGDLERNKVCEKKKAQVSLKIVDADTLASICTILKQTFFSLKHTDFTTNTVVTKEFYCSSRNNATLMLGIGDNSDRYKGFTFNIVER